MGYDEHITRAERWCENRGYEIPWEEWHAFVAEDEELEPDPVGGGAFVLWRGEARFRWWGGNIDTTDPDRRVIDKMLRIAGHWGRSCMATTERTTRRWTSGRKTNRGG
jgi:hypothetical protein